MADRAAEIAEVLRRRIRRGLHAGSVRAGNRLPSARELERDFDADHRIVLAAYRLLATEGLVEIRPRGGIYVASRLAEGGEEPPPSEAWLMDVLLEGLSRDVTVPAVARWLRRATGTLRLRAVAAQATADQIEGMCRELRDDFGLESSGIDVRRLAERPVPLELEEADVLVTTPAFEDPVRRAAEYLRKAAVVVDVRPDLIGGEWTLLLRRPVYAVVVDPRFRDLLRRFFAGTRGADNLRILVLGEDDVTGIPPDAPTYVTRAARERLGPDDLPGRTLPPARVFSMDAARELLRFIVRRNLQALAGDG